MRGETICEMANMVILKFQSTPLTRGETWARRGKGNDPTHFNPLPSCEGRRMMPQNLFETALADVLGQFARALVLSILLLAAAYAVVSGMVERQLTQTEERP